MNSKQEREILNEFSRWAAHPSELGEPPAEVGLKRTYPVNFVGHGRIDVHLISYRSKNGDVGRGFVNPITWSFFGRDINQIPDDSLVQAYCGWAWLFPEIQTGNILTDFKSGGEEAKFRRQMASDIGNFKIKDRFKIGDSEVFEFEGRQRSGERLDVRGAGNTESHLILTGDMPELALPAIYFLIGDMVVEQEF